MKPWLKPEQVRRRIPKGRRLPERFDEFVRAEPPCYVEWNTPEPHGLKKTALKDAVPFLRMPDGVLVAFWYYAAEPAIVQIDAHGELKVLAKDFDHFLKAINAKQTGLSDFDKSENDFRIPNVKGMPARILLPDLQQQFENWYQEHTSLLKPLLSQHAETLRKRVLAIALEMLRDGCDKIYTAKSDWWSMSFKIERLKTGLSLTYLDYGKWHDVPKKYKLTEVVEGLLKLVKHPRRKRFELTVVCVGIVSVDKDRELLLVAPEE